MKFAHGLLGGLLAVFAPVGAFPASQVSVVQKLAEAPHGWAEQDSSVMDKTTSMIKLRIHLAQPRISEFHQHALKIATPGDELYGQHLSREAADAYLAPKPESVKLVLDWLKSQGLDGHSEMGKAQDNVIVHASVAQVERLLNTKYSPFHDAATGEVVMRTLQYSLPDVLREHIDVIQPTTFFGMRNSPKPVHTPAMFEMAAAPTNCSRSSPACLSQLYNYANARSCSRGRMGIAGFIGQFASAPDLSSFMQQFATQGNANESFQCVSVNGGACPADGHGVEANLDTQYVRAITKRVPNVYYSTGGSPPTVGNVTDNEPYLEFLNYLLALPDEQLPTTVSISYGDNEDSVPLDYATKCCDLFAKLGARGVSVLVSSGDTGAGGSRCPTNKFIPAFPASCPWVTTVGGTTGVGPERGWFGSGGGFSNYFAQPAWQALTVTNWLYTDKTHEAQNGFFNASGRAYPDIAALATRFPVVINGTVRSIGGTSASAPVVASLVQLLTSDRLSRGRQPMGFLNPWLYQYGAAGLTDIVEGASEGCVNLNVTGFQAIAGWDPVTGFGTPDYEKLLAISRTSA